MEARMVTLIPKPGHLDDLAAFWDDTVVAEINGLPGNRGFVLLKDAESDRVVGLSLWDASTDADAAGPTVRAHMASISEHLAVPPRITLVEVAASTAGVLNS
jgi:heme-degrading monooxygenase HmoA